jgi:hypothetical protein
MGQEHGSTRAGRFVAIAETPHFRGNRRSAENFNLVSMATSHDLAGLRPWTIDPVFITKGLSRYRGPATGLPPRRPPKLRSTAPINVAGVSTASSPPQWSLSSPSSSQHFITRSIDRQPRKSMADIRYLYKRDGSPSWRTSAGHAYPHHFESTRGDESEPGEWRPIEGSGERPVYGGSNRTKNRDRSGQA